MPIYTYRNKKTGKTLEVIRDFHEYDLPPNDNDSVVVETMTPEELYEAEWERLIAPGIKVMRGENWRGSKGNWIILFITGGLVCLPRFLDMLI